MTGPAREPSSAPNLPPAQPPQWGLLLLLSLVLAFGLEWLRLPAALLLGPMLAGIALARHGATIRVGATPYLAAQALIGCLVARAITPDILTTFSQRWPLFLTVVLTIVAASGALGFTLSRLRVLPGTTAIWGLLPGAATAMMLLADEFGADARLVAFIQYVRLVMVAAAASTIARLYLHTGGTAPTAAGAAVFFPAVDTLALASTLLVAALGGWLGQRARVPAGSMVLPMVVATALHSLGWFTVELPPWLLALSYMVLGWSIGLRFTREVLQHAARALPRTVLSILTLMAFCAGLSLVLVEVVHVDPLTAYLATSPGGLDAVAIIAATSKVDVPFVMSLQAARFICVLLLGPPMSRLLATRLARADTQHERA
jgi:membrane AbrB-like protein